MTMNSTTINQFLEIIVELEKFGSTFLENKTNKKNREVFEKNLDFIKHFFSETFIEHLHLPNASYSFERIDCLDLIRDAITMLRIGYISKDEILHFLTDLQNEKIAEEMYHRL